MYSLNENNELKSVGQSSSIKFFIAQTNQEKESIYQFRYKIFKEELAKVLPLNMQKEKRISDNLDDKSLLLYAASNSQVIGTVRITIDHLNKFPDWLTNVFCLNKLKSILNSDQRIGLLTKLAIAPAYRGSTLMYRFLTEFLQIAYDQDVQIFFSGCNPYLITMYERMGFRRFTNQNFTDPGYGLLVPIIFLTEDLEHFKTVRSPAYRFLKNKNVNSTFKPDNLLEVFPYAKKLINSQLINSEQLWKYISDKLTKTNLENHPLFCKLNKEDCLAFIHLGSIFTCCPGEYILSKNEMSNELYLLLLGNVASKTHLFSPGEYFGGGFLEPVLQKNQIVAVTNAEIMVISAQAFYRFKNTRPYAAELIMSILTQKDLDLMKSLNGMEESI